MYQNEYLACKRVLLFDGMHSLQAAEEVVGKPGLAVILGKNAWNAL
ncbi:MAG: hypothetical protein WCE68_14595 [Anaerolineales bacterium]